MLTATSLSWISEETWIGLLNYTVILKTLGLLELDEMCHETPTGILEIGVEFCGLRKNVWESG